MNPERCIFDAADVDRLVRTMSLADIDREIDFTKRIGQDKSPEIRFYWTDRGKALELARDVAEYCVLNDIPTNENQRIDRRSISLFQEQRLLALIRSFKETQDDVKGLNKALANHLSTQKKKEVVYDR